MSDFYTKPDAVDLLRIVPLSEAERLSGMTADDLRERYSDHLIEIGSNGVGMRVMHALRLLPSRETAIA